MVTITGTISKQSQTLTGSLTGIASAKIPQDVIITPSNIEQIVEAGDGYYLRSVTVKAIDDNNSTEGTENEENN